MHENVGKDSLTFNMLMKHFSTFLADIVITFFWTFIMLKKHIWEHRMESRSSLAYYSKFVWTWYVFNKLRDILFIKAFYFLLWKIYKPLWLMQTVSFLTHNKKLKINLGMFFLQWFLISNVKNAQKFSNYTTPKNH